METNKIIQGDCLETIKSISKNSIDAIITDETYELGFIGEKLDNSDIAYKIELLQEALRVLKLGGYLLAFCVTSSYSNHIGRLPANVIFDEEAVLNVSRFFYFQKPSKSEKYNGFEMDVNNHQTVKPIALIKYLIKLVTSGNGIVLDQFAGNACKELGFRFILTEKEPE